MEGDKVAMGEGASSPSPSTKENPANINLQCTGLSWTFGLKIMKFSTQEGLLLKLLL